MGGRYHDLLHMAIIQEGVWIITALCLAICWLKLLFYVKVNLQMSMLINTIGAMINKLMSFFVIFVVVLLAFICFESVAFGYKVRLSLSLSPWSILYLSDSSVVLHSITSSSNLSLFVKCACVRVAGSNH